MPIIKSAKKRVKIAAKANARNSKTRRNLRDALKAFGQALTSGESAKITKTQHAVMSAIDKAAKAGVIHKNKAARQKARLSAQTKKAGVKPSRAVAKKTVVPKAKVAKKVASTPKKPAKK